MSAKSFARQRQAVEEIEPRNSRNYTKGEKQGSAWASQAGGVFANPLPSELADGFSKTPLHSLRELTLLWPSRLDSLRSGIVQTHRPLASQSALLWQQSCRGLVDENR